jgi:hypothetical protein
MKEILGELPYGPPPDFKVVVHSKFRISLNRALDLYRASREDALGSIYSRQNFFAARSPEAEADLEEVAASCGHFSFSLQEFAEQLRGFLELVDAIQLECEERPTGRSWFWAKNDNGNSPDISCNPGMTPVLYSFREPDPQ